MTQPTIDDLRAIVAAKAKEPKRTRVRCLNCGTAWYVMLTPEEMPKPGEFGAIGGYECEECGTCIVTQKFWTEQGFGPGQVGENTDGCGKIKLRRTS